ncbi:MAG: hypothetical protein AseanaTS_30770 [Candidatus Pelagadaptatus aseana]|uniref:hypothetical protein n=1 Tax=Candidatus Pelagadaptatus aseana TaxID=3120508 RepID=UPI0039B358E2
MKKLLLCVLVAMYSVTGFAKDESCEENVDMADSLDFSKLHVECADDPVTLYDPQSRGAFLSKKKTVTTYDKAAAAEKGAVSSVEAGETKTVSGTQEQVVAEVAELDNAGVIFNIREPFTITGGPQSALNGLFVQMAQYCPKGWTKHEEWVEPSDSGFFLHYQFQCAK